MTLTPPTKQQIAQTIYDWFIVQKNPRSAQSVGSYLCLYRGKNPNERCAVGCCLPDEIYEPKLEGRGIRGIIALSIPVARYFSEPEVESILSDCQLWHDRVSSFGSVNELKQIFDFYEIDISQMPLLQ